MPLKNFCFGKILTSLGDAAPGNGKLLTFSTEREMAIYALVIDLNEGY